MKKTIRYSLMTAAVLMLMGTVASLVFPAQIFALFDAEPELLAAGIQALRIICLGFLISSIGLIYAGTFESFGMGKQSLIISLLRQFVITIPLSFFLSRIWGSCWCMDRFPCIRTVCLDCSLFHAPPVQRWYVFTILTAITESGIPTKSGTNAPQAGSDCSSIILHLHRTYTDHLVPMPFRDTIRMVFASQETLSCEAKNHKYFRPSDRLYLWFTDKTRSCGEVFVFFPISYSF